MQKAGYKMAEMNEQLAAEKIEKFALLMSHLKIKKEDMQLFEIGKKHVHIKMLDEEGDMYEFTFTSANGER